jgi:hypothetical protein
MFFSPGWAKKRGCPLGDKELKMIGKRKSHNHYVALSYGVGCSASVACN